MLTISHAEWQICDIAYRKAYFSKSIRYTDLSFVYFITHKGNVVYVGNTKNPETREKVHYERLRKKRIRSYVITFFGPLEWGLAAKIEMAEIGKRADSKHLLNITYKNKNHGNEEFSIENFRQKGISFVRKRGSITKVVC